MQSTPVEHEKLSASFPPRPVHSALVKGTALTFPGTLAGRPVSPGLAVAAGGAVVMVPCGVPAGLLRSVCEKAEYEKANVAAIDSAARLIKRI